MFMYVENFHANAAKFLEIINALTFENSMFGDEVLNFQHNPPEILKTIETLVGFPVEFGPSSGVYRKPHEFVHYENFSPNSVYVGAVALEDTKMKVHVHKETRAYHIIQIQEPVEDFIKNNCFDNSKWDTLADINIMQGDMLLIQPWMFHSFEKKLMQFFYFDKAKPPQSENKVEEVAETKTSAKPKKSKKK